MLISLGLNKQNIIVCDREGAIYKGRPNTDANKQAFAVETNHRNLAGAMHDADVFIGLSSAGVVNQAMVASMAKDPIIFTLANPEPEIRPELVNEVRDDAIIATGRSDYPNQVNNALCFPYIFRGALDVGASCINEAMKVACVKAIANLATAKPCDIASLAYGNEDLKFGKNYIIPKPFDVRLYTELAYAVAKAAVDSGVATRPITDWLAYKQKLNENIYRSGMVMRPIFAAAKNSEKKMRLVFAEGEDERVIRATQTIVDEKIADVSLIGRPDVIANRIERLGLKLDLDKQNFTIVDPNDDPRYRSYWEKLHSIMARKGITPDIAKEMMRTNNTVIASMLLHMRDVDAMICGTLGNYREHLLSIMNVLGVAEQQSRCAAVSAIAIDNPAIDNGILFITDPYVNIDPTAEQIAEITLMAAEQVRLFGITPKVALLSHSNFGGSLQPQAKKMRQALNIVRNIAPELEIDGEMHADSALSEEIRHRLLPGSTLNGSANLLVMPNIDSANISVNLIKMLGNGQTIGPILMGIKASAHICTPSAKARTLVNLAAIAVAKARLLQG
jgi:malate dehydrogenase (oxaloacetate-decarboxylating)(NADP+)